MRLKEANCLLPIQPAGFFGDVGRNTLSGPGLASLDFSLLKNIPVSSVFEDFRIQFRAEFFNVLNHSNFRPPRSGGPSGVRPVNRLGETVLSSARLTQTATTSRQIQLALKILF